MMVMSSRDKQAGREAVLTDYSRRRLLTYADSFRELADSLDFAFCEEGEDRQQILERKRLWEKQQMLCDNMTEVSKILSRMAAEVFHFVPLPERQQKRVMHAMRGERIAITDMFYIDRPSQEGGQGMRRSLGVHMSTDKPGGYTAAEVADMLSVLLDSRLLSAVTSPYMVDKEERFFFFVEEPYFMVFPGYARATRENETISGDNYSIVESVKGQVTLLLSDGMGSGEKANRDSERVLDIMEKLLEAGYDIPTAIALLNNSLSVSEEEQNMSTLDVCSLDLYNGMCQFRKVGAAASFLKSNSYVERIAMNTLPLGIFQSLETEVVTRELIENDYIIMVTDGIIESLAAGGYEDMLCSYIEDMQETNPGEMARKILQLALRCSNGRIMDDMTVVVLGIYRGRG
ncbi:MAG: SpoIIE family protein phosphatase [Lachnospiraceae bacterium]|nr:SpoIIE family protein phosphatase [Lachnospiraceae bacterium]